nr:unnamed protein product [Spirometra erinaceieuropaei]
MPTTIVGASRRLQAGRGLRGKTRVRNNQTRNNTLSRPPLSPAASIASNIRRILGDTRNNRSDRRATIVAQELACYKVNIAALSETHLSKQGQLEEDGPGYIFFWSGSPKAERQASGVTVAIRNDIVRRLPAAAGHQ